MICFFSSGKSNTWGIYRENVLFFGGSLSKAMVSKCGFSHFLLAFS
jgi:hypothetical protein